MFDDAKKFFEDKLGSIKKEAQEREAFGKAVSGDYQYIDLKTAPVSIEAIALIPEEDSRAGKIAAFALKKQVVAIAALNPDEARTVEIINGIVAKGFEVIVYATSETSLEYAWDFYKYVIKEKGKISGEINISAEQLEKYKTELISVELIKKKFEELSTNKAFTGEFLEVIMAGALANDASDVHLEPTEEAIKFRLRIDGILHDVTEEISKHVYLLLISRIKLLSGLKINIHEEPQDGRFAIKFGGGEIDVRVAIAPSAFGEVVVMRLLDPKNINISIDDLGFRSDDQEIIMRELAQPNGMILNTGPTGSGKTTTLYTFLRYKNSPEIKIITIEDPIEYRLEGIEQTQVKKDAGYTFAGGLSSLMRQDPDVILVGEIRDKETAEIGMQAALTGHLVFSTVHANAAAGAIPRLVDLGVRTSSIGPALNMVIAQRLTRKLCKFCKVEKQQTSEELEKYKKFLSTLPEKVKKDFEIKVFEPKGCEKCNSFGYKGRLGIFELFLVDADVEGLINKEVGEAELYKFAIKQGMVTLQQDGIIKALQGQTSFEEVEAITGPINWQNA